jgi:amino acid transporter
LNSGDKLRLKAVLGLVQLVFYSVGVIVGAGVYSVIGAAAGLAGEGLWLSFVVGAAVAALTAVSYAEMTTSFPTAGAEYVYVRQALPTLHWFSFGIAAVILIGGAAASATVAVAFGGYLRVFVESPPELSALLLLLVCSGLIIWGLREASWVNVLFTSIEVAGLLLVIAAGLMRENFAAPLFHPPQSGVLAGAAVLFFVYLGFEELANLSEEARHPLRDLPRAIFSSLAITTLLYVLVALAAVALVAPSELAKSEAPLATALDAAWPGGTGMLSAIALFATANTVLISLIASSRLAFSMARDGDIPAIFAALLPNWQTPWTAVILCFAMAAVFLPIGDLKILAELSSFAALVAFLAVNLTLIILRYRLPDHPRPFRVPLTVGRMPVLPLVAIGSILVLLVHFDWEIYAAGGIAVVMVGVAFVARRYYVPARRS